MHRNGAEATAALTARVDELEATLRILTRRWETELTPRLLELDRDINQLAAAIAASYRGDTP